MNVKGVLQRLWGNEPVVSVAKPVTEDHGAVQGGNQGSIEPGTNVVALPIKPHHSGFLISGVNEPLRGNGTGASQSPARPKGLMNDPELTMFRRDNHFGLGRHNGANYRSHEALLLGKNALISRFQNIVSDLVERRRERINKLQLESVAINGVSDTISAQLSLACEQLQKDIVALERQAELSLKEQGWVLDALNQYQIGFSKGLREVVNFEMLSQ